MNWSTHGISTSIHTRARRRANKKAREDRRAWASNPPPGVMTEEEIRYWLNALIYQYGWGPQGLARTLGSADGDTIKNKARGKAWIFRTEQLRYSRVLKRIISGELVYRPYVRIAAGCSLADHPVPLPQPVRYEFDFKAGKMTRILPRREGQSTVPSFQGALKNAGRWRECTFPEDERRERDT